jgi:hypothetical protein
MGVFCLCSFIVACKFGAVAFMFVYSLAFSFCMIMLHCFSVFFMIFWYCWVRLLLISVYLIPCMKLFIFCFCSSFDSLTSVFHLSAFVEISLFAVNFFPISVISFHSCLFLPIFYTLFLLYLLYVFCHCVSIIDLFCHVKFTYCSFGFQASVSILSLCLWCK